MLDDIIVTLLGDIMYGSGLHRPLSFGNLISSFANGAACANPEYHYVVPYTSAAQASMAAVTLAKRAYDQKVNSEKKFGLKVETALTAVQHGIGFGCGYVAGYLLK